MANMLLPAEERNLTPEQVEALDARRRRGHLYLILALQSCFVLAILSLWVGQDLTYSPGAAHPIFYIVVVVASMGLYFGVNGVRLRRGLNEFFSY